MVLNKRISFIRKISFCLFIFSLLSLLGSLWLQNTLVELDLRKDFYNKEVEVSGVFKAKRDCSKNDEFCFPKIAKGPDLGYMQVPKTLGACFKYKFSNIYKSEDKIVKSRRFMFINNKITKYSDLKPEFKKTIEVTLKFTDELNPHCIKNHKYYYLYELSPYYHEFLYDLKEISSLGANVSINPFIYGEASISNIVKRFPINFVFKPLLFISVIFMYLYWRSYNFLFSEILNSRNNKFVFFGIASAVFLFLHVLFLGMEIDNKFFKLLRKLVIIFFILSEIIAQFLLSIQLFKNKKKLAYYCNSYIINIKLLFVILIATISALVIFISLIYDLSSKVDYILEWNYFAGLLFYYLLSAVMWKKLTSNPTST